MQILCFGDSNTYGYDPRGFIPGRYDAQNRWTDLIALKTGWDIINEGMNGREIPCNINVTSFLEPYGSVDIFLIMLGTNELLRGLSANTVAERMSRFLQTVPCSGRLILIAPPPMKRGAWVNTDHLVLESYKLASEYKTIAEKLEITFINTHTWNIDLTFDGVHFSEAGNHSFANHIIEYL